MIETELLCTIWLTTVFGYGTKYSNEMIKKYGSAYNALTVGKDDIMFSGFSDEIKFAFQNPDFTYAKYVLDKCKADAISTVCIHEEKFPNLLLEIPNPPTILYYKGNIDIANKMPFTVVGTRKMDKEGKQILRDFVPNLQKAGFTIVAGVAQGAENFIHRNFKETIAVLPCGMNVEAYAQQEALNQSVLKNNGLVITEFAQDMRAFKGNYYLRNRLLAGMSYGVLVTQAGMRSGTSITATAAGDFGRPVYAVPGSIYSVRFKGCIDLIRHGASVVSSADQIAEDFAQLYAEIQAPISNEPIAEKLDLLDERYRNLGETEIAILQCISGDRVHADEITVRTGIDISTVNAVLLELEIDGLVIRLDDNRYMLI